MNAKKLCALLAMLVLVLLGGGASFAELYTIDAVPAATLLLPYFEVDLDAPGDEGVTTLFSINNASAAPTVAHVVIWSNTTFPVLDFNVYLTGYDVQTLNMRDIIRDGVLPATADWDSDGADDISPQGNLGDIPDPLVDNVGGGAGWDQSFGACEGAPGDVPAILLDRLQQGLTGNVTQFDGGCIGNDQGDNVARGYVTVDNVTSCNILFPGDAGYFGTAGVASDVNQLWGDFFIIDGENAYAMGDTLVHLETNPGVVDGQTFYGRYVDFDGSDGREALGNQHAVRYLEGGPFSGGTDLLVWREGAPFDVANNDNAHACGGGPSDWYPMNETSVVAFNEQEQWEELCFPTTTTSPISPNTGDTDDPNCFPLETQRVEIGEGDLTTTYNFGWMFLDLQAPTQHENQSWVTGNMSADGQYSVGLHAIQLNNVTGEPGPN